jgi:hypothetical protein
VPASNRVEDEVEFQQAAKTPALAKIESLLLESAWLDGGLAGTVAFGADSKHAGGSTKRCGGIRA